MSEVITYCFIIGVRVDIQWEIYISLPMLSSHIRKKRKRYYSCSFLLQFFLQGFSHKYYEQVGYFERIWYSVLFSGQEISDVSLMYIYIESSYFPSLVFILDMCTILILTFLLSPHLIYSFKKWRDPTHQFRASWQVKSTLSSIQPI